MRISQKRPYLTILILLLTLVAIVACDPAAKDLESPQQEGEAALPEGHPEVEEAASNDEIEPSSVKPTTAPPPAVNADETTSETDSNGIPVGFTDDGHAYKGNLDAPVVMEEFSDFQCPYCSRWVGQTMPSLLENQVANGELLVVYYDFPLTTIHPQAVGAANAARCAGEQSAVAYWEMHDMLFADFGNWGHNNANDNFISYGETLGLEMEDFTACVEEVRYEDAIQADIDLGYSRGVGSTPSFFINNQALIGAQPVGVFNEAIATISGGGEIASAAPEQPQQQELGPPPELTIPTPLEIPIDGGTTAYTMGDPNAAVTLIEYTDYQCPYCLRHVQETMPDFKTELIDTGRVYYVLKDFPLDSIHPEAFEAAVAARCAGEQEMYLEMHDALFSSQTLWGGIGDADANSYFATLADDLGLNVATFNTCLANEMHAENIIASQSEGQQFGVSGTPNFFFNGYYIRGGFRYEDILPIVEVAEAGELEAMIEENAQASYEAQLAQYEQAKQQLEAPPVPEGPIDVPVEGSYAIGDPDAPVTIVEYTDYQCPYCSRHFAQTFPLIKENYVDTGMVRYVFKDFPLTSIHPQAVLASEAARCAGDQDAYLEMHDVLFASQGEWSGNPNVESLFNGYAADLGLDADRFATCLAERTHETAVMADLDEGIGFGVRGTPAFFINGKNLSGAHPYATFVDAIEQEASTVD